LVRVLIDEALAIRHNRDSVLRMACDDSARVPVDPGRGSV
jgi:hypothetical protein